MYYAIFKKTCTAVMGNIWRICFQFPWQSNVRNGIINIEIYHYRGQVENGCFARGRGQLVVCLCLKAPREFPRAKPPQWVVKTTEYRRFCTFSTAKNWKKIQSGVRHKYTSYSSVKPESWQIALYEAEILHLVVQNAETMGVREGKTRTNWSFYAPKKHFYGCDGSSWVYVWLHRDGITDTVAIIT